MEETGTTIHSGLMRRNKFLRENPQWCQIVALARLSNWARLKVSDRLQTFSERERKIRRASVRTSG
jgi:hypothetical protein